MQKQLASVATEVCKEVNSPQAIAQHIYNLWFLPAAQQGLRMYYVDWKNLQALCGGNHGTADQVITYLEEKEGLKIRNAVPSGERIVFEW